MHPIELFGWFLSAVLTVSFIVSVIFLSRKSKSFSESNDESSKDNNQKLKDKGKRFY